MTTKPIPAPIALCLEDVAASAAAERYTRCVALAGRQPGLGLDEQGELRWQTHASLAAELWVSADARLVLFRPAGAAAPVRLHRADRMLELPEGKPVFVLGGDEVEVGRRRLRVHVHGVAPAVRAPAPLEPDRSARAARIAAVVAIGASVIGCEKPAEPPRPLEVRDQPPAPPPMEPWQPPTDAGPDAAPATAPTNAAPTTSASTPVAPPSPPIEVREDPPDIAAE